MVKVLVKEIEYSLKYFGEGLVTKVNPRVIREFSEEVPVYNMKGEEAKKYAVSQLSKRLLRSNARAEERAKFNRAATVRLLIISDV